MSTQFYFAILLLFHVATNHLNWHAPFPFLFSFLLLLLLNKTHTLFKPDLEFTDCRPTKDPGGSTSRTQGLDHHTSGTNQQTAHAVHPPSNWLEHTMGHVGRDHSDASSIFTCLEKRFPYAFYAVFSSGTPFVNRFTRAGPGFLSSQSSLKTKLLSFCSNYIRQVSST